MKFLLDMPVSQSTAGWLKGRGFDAIHARDIGFERASDEVILNHAAKEGRIVLTMDLDFPTILAFTHAHKPGVVLFRMYRPTPKSIQEHLDILFKTHPESELVSSITIIEDSRIRIRKLPLP